MTGDVALTYPLTDEKKALAERHHNIIWTVTRDMGLMKQLDDFYDTGALALTQHRNMLRPPERLICRLMPRRGWIRSQNFRGKLCII